MDSGFATGNEPLAEAGQSVETFQILHVDDEPEFLDLVSVFLQREDGRFDIVQATSASSGMEKLSERSFDCVVSDYNMPGSNGLEFLKQVREEFPGLPFILFTGEGTEEIASDAISAGVTDYLQKQGSTDCYTVLANTISNAIEHHKSIQKSRQREQQLSDVIERVTDAIVKVDSEWRFTLVNQQAEELYEMDEEDLLGRDFWEVFSEALDTRFEAEYRQVMNTREPTSLAEYFSQLDGWFDIEVYPTDSGGLAFYFTKVSEKLQKCTKQLQDVIDTVEGAMWVRNAENEYVYMNQYHRDAFDIPDDVDVAGKQFADLLPAEVAAQFRANDDRVYETGELVEIEETVMTDDGPRDYLTRITPLYDDGSVYATCGIATDITEQVERKRELQDERNYTTQLIETISDIFYVAEADETIRDWNERVPEVTGYSPEKIADMQAIEFFVEEHRNRVERAIEETLTTGQATVEADILTADGERIPHEFSGSLLTDCTEDFNRLVGIGRDISNHLERERQLQRERDRLDKFAGVLGHDLRNPLNVAEGRLELAMDESESEHLEPMAKAHGRMDQLISDMLSLARAGETIGETEAIELSALVDACWENITTGSADLVIETDDTIQADKTRLKQLLENLLRNAVEHAGPEVTITVGDLEHGFFVEDNGPGIPEDERHDIFDTGYSTTEDGTGLGLNIVNQIVDAHDWRIFLPDEAAGGTRFEITGVEFAAE